MKSRDQEYADRQDPYGHERARSYKGVDVAYQTLFIISSMVPIVIKARIVDSTGTSSRLESGLSGPTLDDDDGEE